uniref:Uncharacterized protein n=1 Tax=Dulem virus 39 TaxID=3145757 RepID=A0AAU8B731_9CAUD
MNTTIEDFKKQIEREIGRKLKFIESHQITVSLQMKTQTVDDILHKYKIDRDKIKIITDNPHKEWWENIKNNISKA